MNWLVYGEKLHESTRDKKKLLSFAELLNNLYVHQQNLSYSHTDFVDIMSKVYDQVKHRLPELSAEQQQDWGECYSKRIRTMCRHAAQAASQIPRSAWYKEIFGDAAASGGKTAAKDTGDAMYGFDSELLKVWRQRPGGPRELASRMEAPEGGAAHDSAVAYCSDGDEHEVAEVSVAHLATLQSGAPQNPRPRGHHHWVGTHAATGLRLRLSDRKDRPGVMCYGLFQADKQVVGLKKSEDENIKKKLLAVMVAVAEDYANGRTLKADLISSRNDKLQAAGLPVPRPGASFIAKRPAAATESYTEAKKGKYEPKQEAVGKVESVVKKEKLLPKAPKEEEDDEEHQEDEESEGDPDYDDG